ncbi:MAG: DUF547 domain-containing protein [Saprospiraceae bacterium]|nr:DUF547 domain-containing protein [Saprospiraceae bacterium]
MRKFFLFLAILMLGSFACTGQSLFSDFDKFFGNHVRDGLVDYSSASKDSDSRNKILQGIKQFPYDEKSKEERMAFLINTYNFFVIHELSNHYPVASPKEIPRFFTEKNYQLNGKKYSLDKIEKDLLFGIERDPRFHLVLICGAKSCPPFYHNTFRSETLDKQLEDATSKAINDNSWLNETDESIWVSQIFSWYGFDFGDLRAFIKTYRPDISSSKPLKFQDYNWAINHIAAIDQSVIASFMTPSQLIAKGNWEFKSFQALYSEKRKDGFDQFNSRSSFFSSFNQFTYGAGSNLNLGFDLVLKRNFQNDFVSSSPFALFNSDNIQSRVDTLTNAEGDVLRRQQAQGLSHIGPKVKFKPFSKIPKLTFQQTAYFPIQKSVDGQWVSFSQFFYDQNLGSRASLFLELSFWTVVHPDFNVFPIPRSFISYFPNKYITIYGLVALYGEFGVGTKINLTRRIELELLHSQFLENNGKRAQTFNLGVRIHP